MARKRANIKRAALEAARAARRRRIYRGLLVTMWLSLLLAGAAGVVEFRRSLLASSWLALRTVEVVGNDTVASWQIRSLGGIHRGDNLLAIDVDRVAAGVKRHPWVAEASVRRIYPDRVRITIRERKPVALLVKASLFYVDADAVVFSRVPPGASMDYPVLTGFDVPALLEHPAVGRKAIRDALALIRKIEAMTPLTGKDVSEVHIDLKEGFSFYAKAKPARILVGWDDFDVRLSRLALLLERERLDLARIRKLDLDLKNQAVVTPI